MTSNIPAPNIPAPNIPAPNVLMPNVLMIVGGGIAAYKSAELVRLLKKRGADVRCVITAGGQQFITPLTLAVLSEHSVYSNLFDLKEESEMGHIRLSRAADVIVVCPATADLLAKMAVGIADDLATSLLLATNKPILVVPAMNPHMWSHSATQRNLARLAEDGIHILQPDAGPTACGENGVGRLPAETVIADHIAMILAADPDRSRQQDSSVQNDSSSLRTEETQGIEETGKPSNRLAGKRVLVTAGPTQEPIDPVRYLANRSSGKQGFAIAAAAARAGGEVVLIAGPVALETPSGVRRIDVQTACAMQAAVEAALPVDVAIMVAAVADWRCANVEEQKIKKHGRASIAARVATYGAENTRDSHVEIDTHDIKHSLTKIEKDSPNNVFGEGEESRRDTENTSFTLTLVANPDIVAGIATHVHRPGLVIGFAAETDNLLQNARDKRIRKGCDWIIANDIAAHPMGGDENHIHILSGDGADETRTSWPPMSKNRLADKLIEKIADDLAPSS